MDLKEWETLANDMNKDSGYPHSHAAAMERGRLEEAWRNAHPGQAVPQVLWSNRAGKYVVAGMLNAGDYFKAVAAIHGELQEIAKRTHDMALAGCASPANAEWQRVMDRQDELLGRLGHLDGQMGL